MALTYQSNITFCTLGVHWLSRTLAQGNDPNETLFPTYFKPRTPLHAEFVQLADVDMRTFYEKRKQDTNVFLGMVNMTKTGEGECTARKTMTIMDQVLREMNRDLNLGIHSGYVPFFYRTSQEYLSHANECGFDVQTEKNVLCPCDYVKLFNEGMLTREGLALAETNMARAWSEWSIKEIVKEAHIEEFYKRVNEQFQKSPQTSGSNYHLQNVILKPHFV